MSCKITGLFVDVTVQVKKQWIVIFYFIHMKIDIHNLKQIDEVIIYLKKEQKILLGHFDETIV